MGHNLGGPGGTAKLWITGGGGPRAVVMLGVAHTAAASVSETVAPTHLPGTLLEERGDPVREPDAAQRVGWDDGRRKGNRPSLQSARTGDWVLMSASTCSRGISRPAGRLRSRGADGDFCR